MPSLDHIVAGNVLTIAGDRRLATSKTPHRRRETGGVTMPAAIALHGDRANQVRTA
jgi:hypothetical protein